MRKLRLYLGGTKPGQMWDKAGIDGPLSGPPEPKPPGLGMVSCLEQRSRKRAKTFTHAECPSLANIVQVQPTTSFSSHERATGRRNRAPRRRCNTNRRVRKNILNQRRFEGVFDSILESFDARVLVPSSMRNRTGARHGRKWWTKGVNLAHNRLKNDLLGCWKAGA